MRKLTKLTILSISAGLLSIGYLAGAMAQTPVYIYEDGNNAVSTGIIEIGGAKFDSTDLKKIYTEVNSGKSAIAQQMTTVANVPDADLKDNGIYTFEKLVGGVNSTYANGKSSTWAEIRDAADGSTLSTDFASVNGVDSLVTAVNESNESYITSPEGKTALANEGYCKTEILTDVSIKPVITAYDWVPCQGKPKYIVFPVDARFSPALALSVMSTGPIDDTTTSGYTHAVDFDGVSHQVYWAYDALNGKIGFHYSDYYPTPITAPTVVLFY